MSTPSSDPSLLESFDLSQLARELNEDLAAQMSDLAQPFDPSEQIPGLKENLAELADQMRDLAKPLDLSALSQPVPGLADLTAPLAPSGPVGRWPLVAGILLLVSTCAADQWVKSHASTPAAAKSRVVPTLEVER